MRNQPQPPDGGKGRHRLLAELADRQHGVVSTAQLKHLGYSKGAIWRACSSGRLHSVDRGVYAVGYRHLSPYGGCFAAVLACGPGAVLSHHSAAWLWGLARWSPGPFHVTGPVARRPRLPVRIHRARRLEEADRWSIEEIPVTAVPRTLLDLAAVLRPDSLLRMLERAEELKLFDLGPTGSLLERTRGHHGSGRLRRAIALYRPAPFTRSQFERRFFEAVLHAGLPRPVTNYVEAGFELDVYWPEYRFAVELDTYATHGTNTAFERDRLRDEDLKLAGIEITRVTDARFYREPEAALERVSMLLSKRREEMGVRGAARPVAGRRRRAWRP